MVLLVWASTSGNTIRGNVNGIFVTFAFDSVRIDKGRTLESGSIAQWAYVSSTGKWQVNSEFDANEKMDIEVTKQSVAVMLVLDCSNSLDNQYNTMLGHARSFIRALQEASYDPYAVSSVRLDYSSKSLAVGESFQLTATVGPNTARDKSVLWTTSDPSVAMVNQDGVVTALEAGTATITVTTIDGGYKATCEVESRYVPVTKISLNETSIFLTEGATDVLMATKTPSNASDRIEWSTSDASVVTVDEDGNVAALAAGQATITANCGEKKAECSVTVILIEEMVDLGLSVKWASCNLCENGFVNSPEQYGDYYAWGETEIKSDYSWSTYKWCNGSSSSLTKYNTKSSYGTVDNKTMLEPEDDVAFVNLGGKWRMPTDAEWTELRTKCSWTVTTLNGVYGIFVTAPNGNSIFLPAVGYRYNADLEYAGSIVYYWSSSLSTGYPDCAWGVFFYSDYYVDRLDEGLNMIPLCLGTSTGSPVTGLCAVLAALSMILKTPNPETLTSSPLTIASSMIVWTSSMILFASSVVMLCLLLISFARSFLFIFFLRDHPLPPFRGIQTIDATIYI